MTRSSRLDDTRHRDEPVEIRSQDTGRQAGRQAGASSWSDKQRTSLNGPSEDKDMNKSRQLTREWLRKKWQQWRENIFSSSCPPTPFLFGGPGINPVLPACRAQTTKLHHQQQRGADPISQQLRDHLSGQIMGSCPLEMRPSRLSDTGHREE